MLKPVNKNLVGTKKNKTFDLGDITVRVATTSDPFDRLGRFASLLLFAP